MLFNLTLEEQDRRWKKIREAMGKRSLGALVVWSSIGHHGTHTANLRYLSNVKTEGYLIFPLEGEPTLFTFIKRPQAGSWVTDFRTGHPTYSRSMSIRVRELHLERANLGLVGLSGYEGEMGFPYTAYMALKRELPNAHFEDATELVEQIRIIKSDAEIKCFESGCEAANEVSQVVISTAKPGVTDYEVIAAMQDTLFRYGCEPDSTIRYHSGKELNHAGQGGLLPPMEKRLAANDAILTEFDAKCLGYMAQHNQPYSLGTPSKEWSKLLSVAVDAFSSGLKTLKPGITSGELDAAFLLPVKKAGYVNLNPAFHGLGLSLEEPFGSFPVQPDYKPDLSQVIQAGMIIEFEPHVVTPDAKKGIHLGCPILVTEMGCRLLNPDWLPEMPTISL